jgi:HAE1 family hydrophobic/amphiphilic exporter-1
VSLTRVAVYRPVVVLIALAIVAVAGALSFRGLGQDFLPQVSLPVVTVAIPYPGAGPIEVEEQVTKVVEDQISGLADVDEITSTSRTGGASIVVTFREGVDADRAALNVRQRVDAARRDLPVSILEPTVGKINITDLPVMTLALVSPEARPTELYRQADVVVRRVLETTDGVGSVRVLGGRKPEAHVTVDPDDLRARGIGLSDLASALGSQFTSTAAGQIRSGTGSTAREASLRVEGRGTDLERLMSLPVRVPGAPPVRLGEIASVDQEGADPDSIIRFNGQSAVGLLVFKVSDANLTQVVDRLRSRLPEANAALPSGYQLEVVGDTSRQVRASVDDVGVEFALASLITSLVLLLFLHKGRTTLIVLLAIPTSLVVTLIAMRYFGISLNIMSLLGLTTCIGILVDDSIVVVETIARKMQPGVDPREAAVQGRGEIGLAAVAITLVDVVVYGPVAVVSGATGEFLRNFALVIVVATLASLLVSFTLAPLLASRWLAAEGTASRLERLAAFWEPLYRLLVRRYARVLDFSVAHPWRVTAGAVLVLVATLALVPRIGTEFVPDQNSSTVTVAGELAGDASLAASEAAARQWEALLSDRAAFPEVRSIFTAVGTGATDSDRGSRFLNITLDIGPGATRHRTNQQIQRRAVEVARAIPGLKPVARAPEGGAGGLQVQVFAPTLPELVAGAEVVRQRLAARPELLDVTVSGGSPSREVIAQVDSQRLGDFGLSTEQVGLAARTAYQGVVAAKLPRPAGAFGA